MSGPGRTGSEHADLDGKEGTLPKGSERFCPGPVKTPPERDPKKGQNSSKRAHFEDPFWRGSGRTGSAHADLGCSKGTLPMGFARAGQKGLRKGPQNGPKRVKIPLFWGILTLFWDPLLEPKSFI